MKLRINGDSVRLRLSAAEVEAVGRGDAVQECTHLSGTNLTYTLRVCDLTPAVSAHFEGGALTVTLPRKAACNWASSAEVGIYSENISIEKDFGCEKRC